MNTLSYNEYPYAQTLNKEEPFIPMLESWGFLARSGKFAGIMALATEHMQIN
jgi:hypothetical protein